MLSTKIYRQSIEFCAKTTVILLGLITNFSQASELSQPISEGQSAPQATITIFPQASELSPMKIMDLSALAEHLSQCVTEDLLAKSRLDSKMSIYQFPNQQEYILICEIHVPGKIFSTRKIYKGTVDFLNELYSTSSDFCGINDGKRIDSLYINTTIGRFTSDQFHFKKALPGPAWYDKLKKQYIPLTFFMPTEDFLTRMVIKDIDMEALKALGEEEGLKQLELIGLSEEEAAQKTSMTESETVVLDEVEICLIM